MLPVTFADLCQNRPAQHLPHPDQPAGPMVPQHVFRIAEHFNPGQASLLSW